MAHKSADGVKVKVKQGDEDPETGDSIYEITYPDGEVRYAHSRTFKDNFKEAR
jgi:hypothetical protein